ncbi:MAG TPA: hypothetical protein DCO72_11260 [Ruminococcus sp.]|nr:hypothetical protein [Ruminococcus sp.]
MEKEKHNHAGHRERMKQRLLLSGFSGFSECEILEFVLYQVQPRIDTKQVAYRLLETFGSLQEVFKADYDSLMKVKGIGRTSAEYICHLWKLQSVYCNYNLESFCLRSVESRQVYFMKRLGNVRQDMMMMACLDDRMRVIECKEIPNSAHTIPETDLLEMIKMLIPVHCNQIVLALKRSQGMTAFCQEEIQFTKRLREYFHPLKIKISDMILIVRGQVISFESDTRL